MTALPISILSSVIGEHREKIVIILVVRQCTPRQIRFKKVKSKIYLPLVESQLNCI